jgi:23S rRNA (cytidine1920-2'-O)/16S rRNA (cytidine1409-2'-O)-methyltransferase
LAVEQGLAPSRTRAQALILAGALLWGDGQRVAKAGQLLPADARLRVKGGDPLRYASRGGLKLEAALRRFRLDPGGSVCLDVGASTGGFTDCLLQHGASRVYAVDVGYGQLVWDLRQDPRVTVIERCNIRTAADDLLPEACGWVVIDVSFISLHLVLPAVVRFLGPEARVVALVKPQFEAGRDQVGKGGIVRDPAVRQSVLLRVETTLQQLGFDALESMDSPVLGGSGNQEMLITAVRAPPDA